MSLEKTNGVHFVYLTHPRDIKSAELQRQASSHASRVQHARRKRLRIIKQQVGESSRTLDDESTVSRGRDLAQFAIEERRDVASTGMRPACSPLVLLSPNRRDPFDVFARSLTSAENFLLDHCMLLSG
jgi:hypothetical protein